MTPSSRPLLICFSHLRWDFVYQRPQHLLSRAAYCYDTYFVEEPLRDSSIKEARLRITKSSENVTVVTPLVAMEQNEHGISALQSALLTEFFAAKPRPAILWYYTPAALAYSGQLKADIVVYDCMDELSAFKGASSHLMDQERELFRLADIVFTGGRSLFEAKRHRHPNVHLFPSSIDKNHFARARVKDVKVPQDQNPIPHPRIGFFGVIDERMDVSLLEQMASLRPDWHFILIGPVVKIDPASLPQRPNIHWLGGKPYSELPDYLAGWDIGFMPFARNDATRFISPTKTPEFLAAGLPVLSTPITDVVRPYGEKGMVEIAEEASGMIQKAEHVLRQPREEWQAKVDDYLRNESWDATWARMKALMEEQNRNRSMQKPTIAKIKESRPVLLSPRVVSSPRQFDWLIVGAGFSGSVMAERLARQGGQKVLLIDKRPHIGGNAYDCKNDAGILIHRYGPHIFHTNSADVFSYLSQFTRWRAYEHKVLAKVDGQFVPIPINLDTINRLYNLSLTSGELVQFFKDRAEKVERIRTSEDVIVNQIGRELYEKFFRTYTRKQWGMDPSQLDKSVTARIPTRTNRDDRYFTDSYQHMPEQGYTALFENMLNHPLITIRLGVDYRQIQADVTYDRLIYTGPIDEFFNYRFGKLPYRSLRFDHVTLEKEWHQKVAVVNYPQDQDYTRVTEYKHLTGQPHPFTSLTYEYPTSEGDPYYPIPRADNRELYRRYQALADEVKNAHFLGRLASYQYYNMDQVVAQALTAFARIKPDLSAAPEENAPLAAVRDKVKNFSSFGKG